MTTTRKVACPAGGPAHQEYQHGIASWVPDCVVDEDLANAIEFFNGSNRGSYFERSLRRYIQLGLTGQDLFEQAWEDNYACQPADLERAIRHMDEEHGDD